MMVLAAILKSRRESQAFTEQGDQFMVFGCRVSGWGARTTLRKLSLWVALLFTMALLECQCGCDAEKGLLALPRDRGRFAWGDDTVGGELRGSTRKTFQRKPHGNLDFGPEEMQ